MISCQKEKAYSQNRRCLGNAIKGIAFICTAIFISLLLNMFYIQCNVFSIGCTACAYFYDILIRDHPFMTSAILGRGNLIEIYRQTVCSKKMLTERVEGKILNVLNGWSLSHLKRTMRILRIADVKEMLQSYHFFICNTHFFVLYLNSAIFVMKLSDVQMPLKFLGY